MTAAGLAAYSLVVALFLATGAWLLERALTGLRLPVRWLWIGGMALSIGLPVSALVTGVGEARTPAGAVSPTEVVPSDAVAAAANRGGDRVLNSVTDPLFGWMKEFNGALAAGTELLPAGRRVDAWVARGWGAATVLVGLALLASMLSLRRRVRSWPEATLVGRRVTISPDLGPATVGRLAPKIVIPRWALDLPSEELDLIVRHEAEHVRARDTVLLAAGLAGVVVCAWNPVVWWQMRRLRDAIEVDCDRRVLRHGVAPAGYGELLVRLGTGGRPVSLLVPTLAGPTSLLERRLTVMKKMREGIRISHVLVATAAGVLLIAAACTAEAPVATDPQALSSVAAGDRASPEGRDEDLVSVRVDLDGTVRVNGSVQPLEGLTESVAPLRTENSVVAIEANRSTPYHVLAEVQDQLRRANLLRVVFITVDSDTQPSPPRTVSTVVDDGRALVLPDTVLVPDLTSWTDRVPPRNLLYLDVPPTGIIGAWRGGSVREIAPSDVEPLLRQELAANPNLIVVLRTHPDAEYWQMYDVLGAIYRAEARRFSLQLAG